MLQKNLLIFIFIAVASINSFAQPIAVISLNDDQACASQNIVLDGSMSSNCTEYYWDFGDGSNSGWITETAVLHSWNSQGTFEITLTVRDLSSTENSTVEQILIIGIDMDITISQAFGYSPLEVGFTTNPISDDIISTIVWDFGDGNTIAGLDTELTNIYEYPGVYSVTVYISTLSGCIGEMNYEDTITVIAEPEIQLSITPASGQDVADGSVNVTVNGGVEPIEITCNSAKAEHEFTELLPGNYTINVEDANGHTANEEFILGWVSKVNDINMENKTSVFSTISEGTLIVQTTYKIPSSIKIINTKGQILFETIPNSERTVIRINDFIDGLYFIKCHFGNNVITNKIFITNR